MTNARSCCGQLQVVRLLSSLFLFPLLFSAGMAVFVYLPREIWRSCWPTTTGIVVYSQREWHVVTPSNRRGYPIADIEYTYSVGGKAYRSDKYDVDGPYRVLLGSEKGIHDLLRKYPEGTTVRVSYKPGDFSLGVLHPTMSLSNWVFAVTANFLLGLVLRLNWAWFRAGGWPRRGGIDWAMFKANLVGRISRKEACEVRRVSPGAAGVARANPLT